MSIIGKHLLSLGIQLPKVAKPVANYIPAMIVDNLVYVSGQITSWEGEVKFKGKVGKDFDIPQGIEAARLCGLNILAQLEYLLGDLDRVKRCIKLGVFVNAAENFFDHPKVANGASDLMVQVFGDAGKHVRFAVGSYNLPLNVAVEVEGLFEITTPM
ncbi:MAG: RidA family protein [Alphaproteobacteria bacterium]|nr:RidA family protein [Alphaproteobacteria bacterium]